MRVDVDATLTGRPQRQQGSGRRTARQMVRERRRLPSEWWCPSVLTMARSVRCPTTETIKSLKFSIRRAGQSGLGCGAFLRNGVVCDSALANSSIFRDRPGVCRPGRRSPCRS